MYASNWFVPLAFGDRYGSTARRVAEALVNVGARGADAEEVFSGTARRVYGLWLSPDDYSMDVWGDLDPKRCEIEEKIAMEEMEKHKELKEEAEGKWAVKDRYWNPDGGLNHERVYPPDFFDDVTVGREGSSLDSPPL